jgi:hypothetical protein
MNMITIDRALVEQALETIEGLTRDRLFTAEWARVHGATIAALRAALAQQEGGGRLPPPLQAEPVQEPVAVSVDALAQHIRFVDGNNNLGAGILAEKIVEFLIKLGIGKEQAEPVQEPVAWAGYDLDGMVEAFSRVIEAHHSSKNPFHDPINTDARMALRILRGLIPAMKAYTAPPQRKPLTEEEIYDMYNEPRSDAEMVAFARAVEAAHGIKERV